MASSSTEEKTQEATPHHLVEARKSGQFPKPVDLVPFITLIGGLVVLSALGWSQMEEVHRYFVRLLAMSRTDRGAMLPITASILSDFLLELLKLISPILFSLVILGVIGNLLAQRGQVYLSPLTLNFSRLDPVAGLKRLWSVRVVYEVIKTVLKVAAILYLIGTNLRDYFNAAFGVMHTDAVALTADFGRLLVSTIWSVAGVLGLFLMVDLYFYQKQFAKQMRMSRTEIKQEFKQREGDPRIRQKIKSLRKELLSKTGSIPDTRKANVLVTNPTHYGVALYYKKDDETPPRVVAKGNGLLVPVMKLIARRAGIKVVQNPVLARALFSEIPIGSVVSEKFYPDLAAIYFELWHPEGRGSV